MSDQEIIANPPHGRVDVASVHGEMLDCAETARVVDELMQEGTSREDALELISIF